MKKPTTKKPCKREEQFKQQRMRICTDYMPIGVPLGPTFKTKTVLDMGE